MKYIAKAMLSKGMQTSIMMKICIVGTVSMAGVVLGIVNLVYHALLFGILYLIGGFIGFSYTIIQMNTMAPTFVAVTEQALWMGNWENGLFPFNVQFSPQFLCDFVPDKVVRNEIEFAKVTKVFVGNKNFLQRTVQNPQFISAIRGVEQQSKRFSRMLGKMELLYIETVDGEYFYMSVTEYDLFDLAGVLTYIAESFPDIQLRCNSQELRRQMGSME